MSDWLSLDDVVLARTRISGHVLRTPLIERQVGDRSFFFKAENLQPIGAFKIRGAFNMMQAIDPERGVVAHSSGNHAQAVARAARVLGRKATIVMPDNAPALKRARTEADGATVVVVGPDSEDRRLEAERLALQDDLLPVPPYDDPLIAAGQGTTACEILEDTDHIDQLFCPVSGGGLLSGMATVFSQLSPKTEIVGVEPADANDVQLSLAAGKREAIATPKTIADGLRVRTPGAGPWSVIRRTVERVALVTDEEMLMAMAWALHELRMVLEPSGAASVAAALREGKGRVAVLLSGGNVDPGLLADVCARVDRLPDLNA